MSQPWIKLAVGHLQALVATGFNEWGRLGEIGVKEHNGMLIFNYTHRAQKKGEWNDFERVCRGLILNAKTGGLIAMGFPKFFNWMEGGRNTKSHVLEVTEKMDGSLGLMYWDGNESKIATRGSFTGEHAIMATEILKSKHKDLYDKFWSEEVTLLFEIVYPDNRIVVDYGDTEDIILIGAMGTTSMDDRTWFPYLTRLAARYSLMTPRYYAFNSWRAIMDAKDKLGNNQEGFVARFADGSRFKFKGDIYTQMHRTLSYLTPKHILEHYVDGTLDSVMLILDESQQSDVMDIVDSIEEFVTLTTDRVRQSYAAAPKESRKEFAIWVMENCKSDSSYMFRMLDGPSIRELCYAHYLK